MEMRNLRDRKNGAVFHSSHVSSADESLLLEPKIGFLSNLLGAVGPTHYGSELGDFETFGKNRFLSQRPGTFSWSWLVSWAYGMEH